MSEHKHNESCNCKEGQGHGHGHHHGEGKGCGCGGHHKHKEHQHEHGHDCDCGHDHNQEEDALVTLTLDDGTNLDCAILTIFPAGDKEYIALLPLNEEGENEDGEVFLYRFIQTPDGEPELENIVDDEEYEVVTDAFDEMLDSEEFDELTEE